MRPAPPSPRRYGPLFADYTGKGWWNGQWVLMRKMSVCVLIAVITAPEENGGMALGFFAVDALIAIVFLPSVDKVTAVIDVFVSLTRVAQLAGVEAFIMDSIDESMFDHIFLISSLVGIAPLMIQVGTGVRIQSSGALCVVPYMPNWHEHEIHGMPLISHTRESSQRVTVAGDPAR